MLQAALLQFASFAIHKRHLLEARVLVTTNDDHLRLLLPNPLVGTVAKVYSDLEVGIVMESIDGMRRSIPDHGWR